jgi:hypothetical protein
MNKTENPVIADAEQAAVQKRREVLKRIGRYAAVSAPAVTLLLAALGKPKKAIAVTAT